MVNTEEKLYSLFCHASGLFFPILGPLIILLFKKDSLFVRNHAREALIFQLAIYIVTYLALWTTFILIGFILVPLLVIFSLVTILMAIIRTIEGKSYHYPITGKWAKKL
ncbi:DUF4870 domain-containing protein [Paenactinomyces guangxiensis]|uniref:DUF4870 domain-containing protein n=1 Tax=Paenactinomyces guangxiensis TaxID=1490290 RepID=A0A7W1WNG1_9BACL|nr:DUF4870 domain-containing protein [Paenactinomyces guangxiensis]MBA4492944.1 DUF4870 domain-containing protein [Paenactinomyces guangxiensis]MBH8590207.1 DUF4870 domain-containing protein [Paenactinomyces guangxiensis]